MELALETAWPDLPLPKVEYNGFPRNSTLVSKRTSSYITRRSRFERSYALLSVSWCFTDSQLETFETFFATELDNGIAQFKIELRYPRNSALKIWAVRFHEGYTTSFEEGTWMVQASLDLVSPVLIPERELLVPVTEGLRACWEALDLEGYANGDPVRTWPDVSGWEHHGTTPPFSGRWPLYITDSFGSSPGVVFNGDTNWFDITCPTDVVHVTVFCVMSMLTAASSFLTSPINWRGEGAAGFSIDDMRGNVMHYGLGFVKTNPSVFLSKEALGGGIPYGYPFGPKMLVVRYSGDGTPAPFPADGGLSFRSQGGVSAVNIDGLPGSDQAKLGRMNGALGAILVYDRDLLDGEILLVEAYLNGRYPCF